MCACRAHDRARKEKGLEPVDRLLYSDKAVLDSIIKRMDLASFKLGDLYAKAREVNAEGHAGKRSKQSAATVVAVDCHYI